MRRILLLAFTLIASPALAQIQPNGGFPQGVTPPIFAQPSSGISGSGIVTAPQILCQDGSANTPCYSWANEATLGFYRASAGVISIANSNVSGAIPFAFAASQFALGSAETIGWASTTTATGAAADVSLSRGAAGQPNWSSASGIRIGSTQTTDPTCTSNCGTSPSLVGTDSEFTLTMGSSGSPASGFVIAFNGTWPSNPQCVGAMAKAGMAVGKLPLTLVTTTTTLTVVTNGTAPATTDIYNFICRAGR